MAKDVAPLQHAAVQKQIHPHRFGNEGVLIGVQTATLNAQSHLLIVNIAVGISALNFKGEPLKFSHRALPLLVFSSFLDDFWALDLRRVLRWNIGSFRSVLRYIEIQFWVVLEGIGVEF